MNKDLLKIISFIDEHHVMSLATTLDKEVSVCSLFYAFDEENLSFIVASSEDTRHITHIKKNANVAGNILLETDKVGKIQGLQFFANMKRVEKESITGKYFKKFPYAKVLAPILWQIDVSEFKLTDNRLGFGKKILYRVTSL